MEKRELKGLEYKTMKLKFGGVGDEVGDGLLRR
jgi:hypothetical protein